jgi:HD-GYP domain-containing protein (c-di-GMP phosphodiesterase class II)
MDNVTGFISVFMSAVSNCRLYSINHESVVGLIEKVFLILNENFNKSGNFEMMIIDNDLVVSNNPLRDIGLQGKNLIKLLKKKGISHINFLKGVPRSELKHLVACLAASKQEIKSSPHIKIGIVDIYLGKTQMERGSDIEKSLSQFTPEQIKKAGEEYNRISPFKKLRLAGFEEIVMHFVLKLKKEFDILKLLEPSQSYYGYDYAHATNVSVLTVFQAQTLGIREELQREIGIAALFHDIGKLLVHREILEKESSLGTQEMNIMELHPLYGAQYLAKLDGLTRLAPIVAFEHHLRYDGRGYPKPRVNDIKQHLCSQITAIADSFDNLRKTASSKKALNIKDMLVTMKTGDPGLFNPFLIDNFIRSIHLSLSR